ncbi:MAG TPA: toprim domain-containing protein, partial [Candidatus Acidoferrales bacterium]|nr:toprim domain-containing protein [Candidatus Acidoferrales bacterium]
PIELDQSPGEKQSRHLKDQLLQIHEQIAQRWQNCLQNEAAGQVARDYLAKRGVTAEAVKLFRLGAAPPSWDDTVNWATSKGHEPDLIEKAGLIIRKSGPVAEDAEIANHKSQIASFYDRFRGRLMFPICDEQGRVIGFSGRVLSGDEKTAKYVNSPETPIFTKSKVFFGLDKSKRAILDAGFAIICEGQLDLIACFMAGVQNVVAPQGTAFTDQHARILKRYVDEVVLCFDSDEAGQSAAVRSLDPLLASGLAVRVAVVPAPHDPDSFIKANGGEAFRKLIESADGFFDYLLNRLCTQNDPNGDKGRNAILRGMAEAVHKTGNTILIDTYAQKTALRLGVSPEAVRAEFTRVRRSEVESQRPEDEEAAVSESEVPRPSVQEFWLLKLLLLHDELAIWAALHLDLNWITHPLAREIVSRRLARQPNGTWKNLAVFLDEFEAQEARDLVTEAAVEDRKIPNPEQQLADVTAKLRNQFLDRQIAALTHKTGLPDTSDTQRIEGLRQQQKLREQKRAPLSPL